MGNLGGYRQVPQPGCWILPVTEQKGPVHPCSASSSSPRAVQTVSPYPCALHETQLRELGGVEQKGALNLLSKEQVPRHETLELPLLVMSLWDSNLVNTGEMAPGPHGWCLSTGLVSLPVMLKKRTSKVRCFLPFEQEHRQEFFTGAGSAPLVHCAGPSSGSVHPHSLYLDSFSLGMMFIDCSSWKSSLQAYGMRSEDTWHDDLQKWHQPE